MSDGPGPTPDGRPKRQHVDEERGFPKSFVEFIYKGVPVSDPALRSSKSYESLGSSRFLGLRPKSLQDLPKFADAEKSEWPNLFLVKMRQCHVCFDFTVNGFENDKLLKTAYLNDLIHYVETYPEPYSRMMLREVFTLLEENIFRTLPPHHRVTGLELERDEEFLEPAWPHMNLVYSFFIKVLEHRQFPVKLAQEFVTEKLVGSLIDLFDSEDSRERECVKTALHRFYIKFVKTRPLIRQLIGHVFATFSLETGVHNGIRELLEIVSSYVQGLAVPLKEEHIFFLQSSVLLLLRPRPYAFYFMFLTRVLANYISKDPTLIRIILSAIFNNWPKTEATKELCFLGSTAHILSVIEEPTLLHPFVQKLFRTLATCCSSFHHQVAEEALSLLGKPPVSGLVLASQEPFPLLFDAVMTARTSHWSGGVRATAAQTLDTLRHVDPAQFQLCHDAYENRDATRLAKEEERRRRWALVERLAGLPPSDLLPLPPHTALHAPLPIVPDLSPSPQTSPEPALRIRSSRDRERSEKSRRKEKKGNKKRASKNHRHRSTED